MFMKQPRTCEQCQGEFLAYPSQIKYSGARFCSKDCRDAFQKGENSPRWVDKPELVCKNCHSTFVLDKWRLKETFRGQFCSRDCRYKFCVGENSYNWRGGSTREGIRVRSRKESLEWRRKVLERDNYTCVWCGSKEKLQVDHIKSFALYPELRTDLGNGRVLCQPCHTKTDNFGATRRDDKGRFAAVG